MPKLSEYHKKRDFQQNAGTRRPSPADSASRVFVVQKHAATRLHYDLRLELDGVLKSWAVPKGPSMNPGDKRLAIQVEDHPYDYRKFEGSIPKGEYGGGEVIVWDEGTYAPEGGMSAHEGLAKGDFKFQLFGEKLRGSFVLVRIKHSKTGAKNEWLLIKHRDSFDRSQLGRRAARRIRAYRPHARRHRQRASRLRQSRATSILPRSPAPQRRRCRRCPRASPSTSPSFRSAPSRIPTGCSKSNGTACALSPKSKMEKPRYGLAPAATSPANIPNSPISPPTSASRSAIADGEIATLDDEGRSDFQKLQNRLGSQNPSQKVMQSIPVNYYFFDILYADGYDLRRVPLLERKQFLKDVLITDNRIHFSDHVAEQGEALFEAAREKGLEGIIAKKADSTYAGSRTSSWVKIKIVQELDAVIAGYTAGRGSRKFFGALVLGLYDERELKFIGNVGTGFDESKQEKIFDQLEEMKTPHAAFKKFLR